MVQVTIKVVLTDCASYFVTEEHMTILENENVIVCKNQDEWAVRLKNICSCQIIACSQERSHKSRKYL